MAQAPSHPAVLLAKGAVEHTDADIGQAVAEGENPQIAGHDLVGDDDRQGLAVEG